MKPRTGAAAQARAGSEASALNAANDNAARTVHIGDCVLYQANAFALMPELGEVDCIFTDPPYNAKTHKGARSAKSLNASRIDFESLTDEQFLDFCYCGLALARRWIVMSCAWQHAALLEKAGLPLVRLGIWHKPNAAPQFSGDRPGMGYEPLAMLHREGRKRWNGGGAPCGLGVQCRARSTSYAETPEAGFGLGGEVQRPRRAGARSLYGIGHHGRRLRAAGAQIHRHRKAAGLL